MKLSTVSKYFDRETFYDSYQLSTSFKGQLNTFSDVVSSGRAQSRRVLSVAENVNIPTRRTIQSFSGTTFLVGEVEEDYFFDEVVRKKYPVIPVGTQAVIRTVAEVLAGTGGSTDVYIKLDFMDTTKLLQETSDKHLVGLVTISSYEDVSHDQVLLDGSKYYRVLSDSYVDGAGFQVAPVLRIGQPLYTVTYTTKSATYNPVTDTHSTVAITNVPIFMERALEEFDFTRLDFAKIEPGDKLIHVLKADVTTASVGDSMSHGYEVIHVVDDNLTWKLHCRKT